MNETLNGLELVICRIGDAAEGPRLAAECQSRVAMQAHAAIAALQEKLVAMVADRLGPTARGPVPDPDASPLRQVVPCGHCGDPSP